MSFYQLFYHLVWTTKERHPLLTPEVEPKIHNFLRAKAVGLGATVFALNGIADHVHIVVSLPPKVSVSKFIGQIKGVSSTKFNKLDQSQIPFFWQNEYGAFSFDGKRLPNYITYVERQKEHHANQTTIPILERVTVGGVKMIRDAATFYMFEDAEWRKELAEFGDAVITDE